MGETRDEVVCFLKTEILQEARNRVNFLYSFLWEKMIAWVKRGFTEG